MQPGDGVGGARGVAEDFGDDEADGGVADVLDFRLDDADVHVEAAGNAGEQRFVDFVAEEADFDDGVDAVGAQALLVAVRQVKALGLRDEALAERGLWRGEEGIDIGGLDQLSVFDERNFVANLFYHFHFVGNHQDGEAEFFVDVAQEGEDVFGGFRVKRRGGFVREQHLRFGGQGAGNGDALFLSAGELRRVMARLVFEAGQRQQRVDFGGDGFFVRADEFQRQGDVVVHRAAGEQVEVLEDHADFVARLEEFGGGERGEFLSGDDDAAAVRALQQVDAADEGGFARAALADDAVDFAGGDVQRDAVQRVDFAAFVTVGFLQVFEGDHVGFPCGRAIIVARCAPRYERFS